MTAAELQQRLNEAGIPSSKAYTAADAAEDPQFRYRGMVREIEDPSLGTVLHSGFVPHVPESPGEIRWPGPDIGQHSDEILASIGVSAHTIADLRNREVIR
jgi:crotonobetainyl-CoA:carnitine CoA-transferase CaiB-like acyl-CoA transferase